MTVNFRVSMSLVLLALALSLTACGGDNSGYSASGVPDGGGVPRNLNRFVATLEQDNFIVQSGNLALVDILSLVSQGLMPSAYGNNAGATYFTAILPPAPGQNPASGQTPPVNYNPADPNNAVANPDILPVGGTYKLRPDEAVVIVTRTPPKATYFGYVGYITLTANKPDKDYSQVLTTGNAIVGMYHRIFGSLHDTVSNRRIKCDATLNGVSDNPFDSATVMIFSPDRDINTRVRHALEAAGYPSAIINDMVIPSSLVKLGLEKGKDCFNFVGRVTMWDDEAAGKDYTAHLGQNSSVYRVTPKDSPSLNPFPMPTTIRQDTGRSEEQVLPGLETDLDTIRAAILAQYAGPNYTYSDLQDHVWIPYGYTGYNLDQDCLADNRDAIYLATGNFHFATDDDFAVVYGVNHDAIGTTLYCNLSVYGMALLNGVAGTYSPSYAHTADGYLPAGRKDKYYVYRVARSLAYAGEPCVVVPKMTNNPQGKAFGIDNSATDNMFMTFRYYATPMTGVAPSQYEVSYDRAIVFHRQ